MSLNSIFSIFLPKEDKFFPMFRRMGEALVEAADLFTLLISETNRQKQEQIYPQIKTLETECDQIVIKIFEELNDAFVAPFDREDMHSLTDTLDDVMDLITSSAKRILLYRPKQIPNDAMHMAEIILEGTKCIRTGMNELKTMAKRSDLALDQCQKLHDLEHEGDEVYENFLKDLFNNETDAIELVKMKDLMQGMESATDKANSVGKTLKTIIVKYA
jgi:predicted phosphate transport protein (TIGR00153 family)